MHLLGKIQGDPFTWQRGHFLFCQHIVVCLSKATNTQNIKQSATMRAARKAYLSHYTKTAVAHNHDS